MKTKLIWANLATKVLKRTTKFYTKLGFKANDCGAAQAKELVSFSFGEKGFVVNFFLKKILEKNTRCDLASPKKGSEIIFSLSAESRKEVDAWVKLVKKAGGKVTVKPYKIGEGYTFVFADPDGHKFNVLYWPGM